MNISAQILQHQRGFPEHLDYTSKFSFPSASFVDTSLPPTYIFLYSINRDILHWLYLNVVKFNLMSSISCPYLQSYICFVSSAYWVLRSCPTLCRPHRQQSLSNAIPGILPGRALEWVAGLATQCMVKRVKVKSLSGATLAGPHSYSLQAPPSWIFSESTGWVWCAYNICAEVYLNE